MSIDESGESDSSFDLLDTDVICRYLLNDFPGAQSARAAALIDTEQRIRIAPLTLAEVGHVLRSVYGRSPEEIATSLILFLERENVDVLDLETEVVLEALEMTRPSRRVSISDAMLWAHARSSSARIRTFDRRFPQEGVEVLEP